MKVGDLRPVIPRKDGDFTYIFTKIIDLPEFVQVEKRSDFMQSCRNFGTVMPGRKFLGKVEAQSKEKHGLLDGGPYAVVYYSLTLCPLQGQLQHIYHGQPYARVNLNPVLESTLSPSQGVWICPLDLVRLLLADVIRPELIKRIG